MIVSDGTGNKIDEKVAKIIAQAHMRAIEILKDNIDKLHEISDFLLKEETITGEEFMAILNKNEVIVDEEENDEDEQKIITEDLSDKGSDSIKDHDSNTDI